MKSPVLALGLLSAALLSGCMQQISSTELYESIGAVNDQFMEAFASGNGTAVAALYTEDAEIFPPTGESIAGRTGIADIWQGAMDAGVASITLTIDELEGFGNTAYEVSRYSLLDEDGNVLGDGRYIVIWKRTQDGWRLHRDIWN